jgi:predicted DNA-binding protein (MmcQ/YjbR family)
VEAVNDQEVQAVADRAAAELPGVTFEHRVSPNWDTYKVGGKVFMLMTDMPGRRVVIVKAKPEDAVALREEYAEITPGYHMNKDHWITAAAGPGLDASVLKDLVTDSYRLVVDKLPKSTRP